MGDGLRLTLGWVADAAGGGIRAGDPAGDVGRVVTDTRALQPGDFFVALRGSRYDGHAFVAEALGRGAGGVMVQRGFAPPPGDGAASATAALIEVGDTTTALQDLARAVRRASGARVVAITGSAGKTTTKDAAAVFLADRFRVVKNEGNLNNHIGLPLSLLRLRERPDVAVMELGMNHAGEISTLVAIAEPEHRVWTNVGDAHIGFFASPEALADAKAEIMERAGPGDVLVCNADDPRVMTRAARFPGRVVSFGSSDAAAVRATDVEALGTDGMRARVVTPGGEAVVRTPLIGRGNLENVLAATAVALDFGISLESVAAAAERLAPASRRGAVHRLREGTVLIDDSYNSSPTALARALEVLAHDTRAARRVAVLGEMRELGARSLDLHAEAGRRAAAAGLGLLIAVGGSPARHLAEAAVAAGMPDADVTWFPESGPASAAVTAAIRPGDLVLVKGSRGVRMDVVADRIAAELA